MTTFILLGLLEKSYLHLQENQAGRRKMPQHISNRNKTTSWQNGILIIEKIVWHPGFWNVCSIYGFFLQTMMYLLKVSILQCILVWIYPCLYFQFFDIHICSLCVFVVITSLLIWLKNSKLVISLMFHLSIHRLNGWYFTNSLYLIGYLKCVCGCTEARGVRIYACALVSGKRLTKRMVCFSRACPPII